MKMEKNSKKMTERFKKLYTGCVSDVLWAMGYSSQVIDSAYRPISPGLKICGPALTIATLPVRKGPEKSIKNEALESVRPGDVVVIEEGVGFGGNMGTAIKVRGAEGVICHYVRDIFEHRERGLSVWAKIIYSGGAHSASKKYFMHNYNVPIGLTGVQIRPRDFIFADYDGILVVPKNVAEKVLEYAESYEKLDMEVAEGLLAEKSVVEAYEAKANWINRIGIKK